MDIKEQLRLLPTSSGSYQFYDDTNTIIYIGKAKNLKRRVTSYFNKKHTSPKLQIMVPQIKKIEFINVFDWTLQYYVLCYSTG